VFWEWGGEDGEVGVRDGVDEGGVREDGGLDVGELGGWGGD